MTADNYQDQSLRKIRRPITLMQYTIETKVTKTSKRSGNPARVSKSKSKGSTHIQRECYLKCQRYDKIAAVRSQGNGRGGEILAESSHS
jgi:hypothetical protein